MDKPDDCILDSPRRIDTLTMEELHKLLRDAQKEEWPADKTEAERLMDLAKTPGC